MGGGNLSVWSSSPTTVTVPTDQTEETKLNSDPKTKPGEQKEMAPMREVNRLHGAQKKGEQTSLMLIVGPLIFRCVIIVEFYFGRARSFSNGAGYV